MITFFQDRPVAFFVLVGAVAGAAFALILSLGGQPKGGMELAGLVFAVLLAAAAGLGNELRAYLGSPRLASTVGSMAAVFASVLLAYLGMVYLLK